MGLLHTTACTCDEAALKAELVGGVRWERMLVNDSPNSLFSVPDDSVPNNKWVWVGWVSPSRFCRTCSSESMLVGEEALANNNFDCTGTGVPAEKRRW